MDEAAPAAGAAAEKKRRLLRRPPTSLIVTLLGIALTAWLLPAFTRQLDDRQKAHELKAAVVGQAAAASARALTGGEQLILSARGRRSSRILQPLPSAEREWAISSLEIESRLGAYFPRQIVTAWQKYSLLVDFSLSAAAGANPKAMGSVASTEAIQSPDAALSKPLRANLNRSLASVVHFTYDWRTTSRPHISERERDRERKPVFDEFQRRVEVSLLRVEQQITVLVLAAHPTGYSTTTHDLLRDLIP